MSDIRAAIDQASATARDKMATLDQATTERLLTLYHDAEKTLVVELARYADGNNTLRLVVLRDYLKQVRSILDQLRLAQSQQLIGVLRDSAELGAAVFVTGPRITVVAESAVRFAEQFVGADGLKLSDRLWRVENGAMQTIAEQLRRSLVMGHDASAAVADFMARGETAPLDMTQRAGQSGVDALAGTVRDAMTTGTGNAYSNALRVFRTELNRAHTQAYQAGASAHPDVIGMKYNLSPNHPRRDICDVYAHANLYGLGPGVYPVGQAPWPAHPNTMSYLTAVFRDEVSAKDRAGQQDAVGYLDRLTAEHQDQILGQAKGAALRAGVLSAADLETPWKDLKVRYEQRGYSF